MKNVDKEATETKQLRNFISDMSAKFVAKYCQSEENSVVW